MNQTATIEAPEAVAPTPSPIVRYTPTEAGLAELSSRLQGVVYDVRTTKGMDEARKDRRECVSLRVALENARTDEKADIVARGKLIDGEAKRIREAIEALEQPIDDVIKAEEKRKADEKAAREAIAAGIQKRIDWIRRCVTQAVGKSAVEIVAFAGTLAALPIGPELYGESVQLATDERTTALAKLQQMAEAAAAQEAEAARLKAEREQLEADQRAAREREQREAEERRQLQAKEDEERADRIAAEDAQRKAAQDEEDRKAKAARDEQDRIASEKRAAEKKVLDDQAAEIRKQQDEAAAKVRANEDAARAAAADAYSKLQAEANPWPYLLAVRATAFKALQPDSEISKAQALEDIVAAIDTACAARGALEAEQAQVRG